MRFAVIVDGAISGRMSYDSWRAAYAAAMKLKRRGLHGIIVPATSIA